VQLYREKDIYRMAKIRERKTRDINQVKCIKDEANQLLVKNEEIKNRWKEYFNKLFNGGNESSTIELDEPFDDNNRMKLASKRMNCKTLLFCHLILT
jgi:hypothetical protein